MKLYLRVKAILQRDELARNSDRHLIWQVFKETQTVKNGSISYLDFMDSISTESIRRNRQKIQERYPELRGSEVVQSYRKEKESGFPRWVFDEDGTARLIE